VNSPFFDVFLNVLLMIFVVSGVYLLPNYCQVSTGFSITGIYYITGISSSIQLQSLAA
jgi:hypothetical protein